MLLISDQTAGPNGLKFFVDTHGWPGVLKAKEIQNIFTSFLKKIPRATPGSPASTI